MMIMAHSGTTCTEGQYQSRSETLLYSASEREISGKRERGEETHHCRERSPKATSSSIRVQRKERGRRTDRRRS